MHNKITHVLEPKNEKWIFILFNKPEQNKTKPGLFDIIKWQEHPYIH